MAERIVINTTDIINISGCSLRVAQRRLKKVREALNKNSRDDITFKEYSLFFRLPVDEVISSVK